MLENTIESWKKNLTALCVSQFFYRAGTRALIPFLPLFIQDLGKTSAELTAVWSGWIFAAPFIVSFFTTPLWGSFGDKYGRKLMTLIAVFGFAFSQLLMGFSVSLVQLLIFSALQESFGGFYPAAVSLTASNTPKEKTAHALGMLQFANGSGNVIGPLLGGLIADQFGYREAFYLISIIAVFSGLIIFLFIDEKNYTKEKHNYHSLLKNFKYVTKSRVLISCVFFLLLYSIAVTVVRPTFVLFINSFQFTANNPATITGILLALFGITSAISSALIGRLEKKINIRFILITASIFIAVTYIMIAVVNSMYSLAIVLALCGFGLGIILPSVFTLISNSTDSERKAGIFGISSSFQLVGNQAGSVSAGYFLSSLGLRFPFIAAGVLFFLSIPITVFGLKNTEH